MGWYFRKSLNFGPVRLNLSRAGLGASVGVRGARIGTGPRGSYVHLGTGGIYYRQSLGPPAGRRRGPGPAGWSPAASPPTGPAMREPEHGMRPLGTPAR